MTFRSSHGPVCDALAGRRCIASCRGVSCRKRVRDTGLLGTSLALVDGAIGIV